MKIKISKLKLFSIILLGFLVFSFLPQSVEADIHTAATCSQADVQAAVNASITGDTVAIPVGSCIWSSPVTVSKSIKLKGAGVSTIITASGNNNLIESYGSNPEISDMHLKSGWIGFQIIQINGNGWYIHDITFEATGLGKLAAVFARGTSVYPDPSGLVSNCTMSNARVDTMGSAQLLTEGDSENAIYAKALGLGGSGAVYIEDNVFTATYGGNFIDGNYSASYVARYNTFTVPGSGYIIEAHSLQSLINRSVRKWEFYGNSLTGVSKIGPFFIRGGTGAAFFNKLSGTWGSQTIRLDNVRSFTDVGGTAGLCDGDSLWDGNSDATGWPCRDQIGRGPDATQWENDPPSVFSQTSLPAYFWANKRTDGTDLLATVVNNSGNHIQTNRDYYDYNASFDGTSGTGCGTLASRPVTCTTGVGYWATDQSCSDLTGMVGANPANPISGTLYKCTATNTWTAYYVPYAYPHPLRVEVVDTTPPAPPTGVAVI